MARMLADVQPSCDRRQRMNNSRTTNTAQARREQAVSKVSTAYSGDRPPVVSIANLLRSQPPSSAGVWRVSGGTPMLVVQLAGIAQLTKAMTRATIVTL